MATTKKTQHLSLQQMGFNDINAPGVYIDTQNGDLFRVAPDAVSEGRSPKITTFSNRSVARLSEDWKITRSKAISLAADFDFFVNDDNEVYA